jgi:hypothetical protein
VDPDLKPIGPVEVPEDGLAVAEVVQDMRDHVLVRYLMNHPVTLFPKRGERDQVSDMSTPRAHSLMVTWARLGATKKWGAFGFEGE